MKVHYSAVPYLKSTCGRSLEFSGVATNAWRKVTCNRCLVKKPKPKAQKAPQDE